MAQFSERLGSATVEIRASTDKLRKDMAVAQASVSKSAKRMAMSLKAAFLVGTAAVTAFLFAMKKVTERFDALIKASRRAGIEFETFQKLAVATQVAGGDVKSLENSLRFFTKVLSDAERGLSTAKDALDLFAESTGGMALDLNDANKAFFQAIEGLRQIEDVTKRNQTAFLLFGSRTSKVALDLANMPLEEFNKLMAETAVITEEDAMRMEQFNDSLVKIGNTTAVFAGKHLVGLLEVLDRIIQKMDDFLGGMRGFFRSIGEAGFSLRNALFGTLGEEELSMEELVEQGKAIEKAVKEAGLAVEKELDQGIKQATVSAQELNETLAETAPIVEQTTTQVDKVGEELKSQSDEFKDDLKGFFSDLTSGTEVEDAFASLAKKIADRFISELIDEMFASAGGIGSGGGGGGLGDLIGGIFGGISSIFGGFFADGGQPPMGKVSVVGENGPELFVPHTAGTIVPDGTLGGGGQTVVINNDFTGVDAVNRAELLRFGKVIEAQVTNNVINTARNGGTKSRNLRGE